MSRRNTSSDQATGDNALAEAQGTIYVVGRAAVSYASTQSGLEAGKSEQKERSQEDTDYGQASSGKDSQGQCRFAGRRFGIRRLNTALDPKATTCRAAAHLRRWNDWNEK